MMMIDDMTVQFRSDGITVYNKCLKLIPFSLVIKILGWTTLSIWQGVVPKLISAAPPESSATITTLTLATRLGATCMLPVVRPVAWLSVRNAIFRCPLHTYRGISQVLTFSVWIAAIMYRITAINPQVLALFALPCTDRLPLLRTLRL